MRFTAALYAFARPRGKPVLCFALVTNRMCQEGDLEKGNANDATASPALVRAVAWFRPRKGDGVVQARRPPTSLGSHRSCGAEGEVSFRFLGGVIAIG
jgi:hypothetical protein